jgi:hypothetical protein
MMVIETALLFPLRYERWIVLVEKNRAEQKMGLGI